MASLKYMLILKTKNSALFADKVYEAAKKIARKRYDEAKGDERKEWGNFLGTKHYGEVDATHFASGEVKPQSLENVRFKDVYLIDSFVDLKGLYNPSYERLLLTNDALRRAAAQRITNILPHMSYQRQDRKTEPRTPISAKMFAKMLEESGAQLVITTDMHAPQIQGFFDIAVDDLTALPLFAYHFNGMGIDKDTLTVASADESGAKRARKLLKYFGMTPKNMAMIVKDRPEPNEAEVTYVVGDIKKNVIVIDDMVDTGGSVKAAADALREKGAESIYVCATHGIFSPKDGVPAEKKLKDADVKVVVTDTVPRNSEYCHRNGDWLTVVSVAPMFADAILRTQTSESLGQYLFNQDYINALYSGIAPKKDNSRTRIRIAKP